MKLMTCAFSVGLVLLVGAEPPANLTSLEDPRVVTVVGLQGDLEAAKVFKTSNREPMLVADFSCEKTIRRVSTTYRGPAARIEFFLFGADCKIEFKKNDFEVLCADIKSVEELFTTAPAEQRRPIASVLVQRANEPVNLRRFFSPATGRYLVITYSPQTRDQSGTGIGKVSQFDAGLTDPGTGPTPDVPTILPPPQDGIPPISR